MFEFFLIIIFSIFLSKYLSDAMDIKNEIKIKRIAARTGLSKKEVEEAVYKNTGYRLPESKRSFEGSWEEPFFFEEFIDTDKKE